MAFSASSIFSSRSAPAADASSPFWHILSALLGLGYTLSWSLSFYPQILLNVKRRSTVGTTPSFPILNVVGFLCYSVSTLSFLASSVVQQQYQDRHDGAENTVRVNDFIFAAHALVLSTVTLSQYWSGLWGFEHRKVRVGKGVWGIIGGSFVGIMWTVGLAMTDEAQSWQWLDVVYAIGYVKLLVTVVKYSPQAYTNFIRQSTVGWSIYPMLLDLVGGVLSIAQLVLDSSLQRDWSGLTGNPVKLGLGNVSILFDILFIVQHCILYPASKTMDASDGERQNLLGRDEAA